MNVTRASDGRRTTRSWRRGSAYTALTLSGLLFGASCSARDLNSTGGPDGDGGLPAPPDLAFAGPYSDFPSAPVAAGSIDPKQSGALGGAFGAPDRGMPGGPCLTEPTIDAMYPRNFSPPLFEWSAIPGHNVYELRLAIDNQVTPLVVYTDQTSYTLTPAMWTALGVHSAGHDVAISVRSGTWQQGTLTAGPLQGTAGPVHIAPVDAPGTVVYWTTSGMTALKGFHIGDAAASTVLTPQKLRDTVPGDDTQCIGCHTSSPDGQLAFVGRGANPGGGPFGIDARLVDGTAERAGTSAVSAAAITQLLREFQVMPTLSPAHYSPTDAVALSLWNGGNGLSYDLIWTDLHSGDSGVMQRTGDTGQPDAPSFAHDGTQVAYGSSTGMITIYGGPAKVDLYTIPYNNHQGGPATPLPGASDPTYNEYYPTYAPTDRLIAFNRIPVDTPTYNSAQAEVFVIPRDGGTATRLAANDPPACAGLNSPGLTNSWPRWAPAAMASGDRLYYWMIFSSRRRPAGTGLPQLYLTAVVTGTTGDGKTQVKSYPAVYVTTQVATEANHTPAWDLFMIPPG